MKNRFRKCYIVIVMVIVIFTITFGQQRVEKDSTALLLSRLDLTKPGLEKVKASLANPEIAVKELLSYYRARTSVKHPVDRSLKQYSLGNYADISDIEVADDALKHIFVGHRSFPPHAYGDDIDWGSRPYFDNEWVWAINRMNFWISMSLVYWHTGDEKYAREWAFQLTDWVKKNPIDKTEDQYSGKNFAWRSIEAGIRGYQWTFLFQRFIDSHAFTPELLVTFLNCCYQHANYLMTIYNAGNNWGLMGAEGMAFIAIMFPEFKDAEKWKTEAIRRLNREIDNQVNPDGHQCELAIGYHLMCINLFSRTLDLAKMNGMEDIFPESYRKKIEKMCEVPMKLGLPDGSNTQFGDSWKGDPGSNWALLKQWAERYKRLDFLYVATEGKEGIKPNETAFAYKESGLYSMRNGWDKNDICLVLKCGRGGGYAHVQPDNGTFELYAGGRHLMPDAGSFVYDSDSVNRAWFRQTKVHQTLTLDGKNTQWAPKCLHWQTGDDLDIVVVENAGYSNLTHRRAVFFVDKAYFVVLDEAIGEGTGDVDVHFQFAPIEAKFNYANKSTQTMYKDGWNVWVQNVLPKEAIMMEEEGHVSFIYQQKEPRPAFCYRVPKKSTESGVRFITIVAPYTQNTPEIKVELLGNPAIGSNKIELKVSVNGKSKQIGYDLSADRATTSVSASESGSYWNINTPLTPYRLPPPPVNYQPKSIDLNGDGKPDAIMSVTANDIPILWLDDDGSMKNGDLEGNTINGCLLIDRNKDGKYGSWGDLIIDWVDTNDDNEADMMIVLEYPDSLPENPWPNGHYMIVLDTDHDQIFNYIDWNKLELHNWERIGLSDFLTDYSGNSTFLKIHAYTGGIDDLRLNWENPFLFYDPDGDGLSEMAIRLLDEPQYYTGTVNGKLAKRAKLSGRITWASIAIDMDNDNGPRNEFDFDMTLNFFGKGFDYMDQVHPIRNIRGMSEADKFFIDPRYRQLTELIYPDHKAAPRLIFDRGEWNQIWFTYDEDDDCHRWERVELYYPGDPFKIGTGKGGIDSNPQTDAAGDRGEWDRDASGDGKLYLGNFDGRLHLFGAEWGCWRIDMNATTYQGMDRTWVGREPKNEATNEKINRYRLVYQGEDPKKFATIKYTDTDNNGFFDKIEYDMNGDEVFEDIVELKKLGIDDRGEIIDISNFEYADYYQLKKRMSEKMWANALLAEKVAKKFGINVQWYAKLHESTSLFQKYSNGYWLQLYLYKDLQYHFLRKKDSEYLKKLEQAYYSSNWEILLK